MRTTNTFLIAVMLGVAAALGTSAALRTVHLGASAAKSSTVPNHAIKQRTAKLNRAEVSLRQALAKKPPKLPRVPHFKPVHVPSAPAAPVAAPATAAPAPHVIYQRPPPIIVHKHRAGGEDGGHDHEGGGDGGGHDD